MKALNAIKVRPWRVAILAVVLTGAVAGSAFAAVSALTLDRTAQLSPTGLHATLTGGITCDAGTTTFLDGRIVQPQNTSAFGSTQIVCTGASQRYAIDVATSAFVLRPGSASADVTALQCNETGCTSTVTDARITLRR